MAIGMERYDTAGWRLMLDIYLAASILHIEPLCTGYVNDVRFALFLYILGLPIANDTRLSLVMFLTYMITPFRKGWNRKTFYEAVDTAVRAFLWIAIAAAFHGQGSAVASCDLN